MVKIQQTIDLLKKCGYDGYCWIEFGDREDNLPLMGEIINMIDSWL
ncbi:MAG: hypothetical protein IJ365_06165 [Clostridia bacterium]|nr:hypothetical protein [Clostridia bacterium]